MSYQSASRRERDRERERKSEPQRNRTRALTVAQLQGIMIAEIDIVELSQP